MGDSILIQEALKRGSAHAWSGRWQQAAEEYRLALKQDPEDISALTFLAVALDRLGRLREPLPVYQRLCCNQPANPKTLLRLAQIHRALGNAEAAADSFRALAEIENLPHRSRHPRRVRRRQRRPPQQPSPGGWR